MKILSLLFGILFTATSLTATSDNQWEMYNNNSFYAYTGDFELLHKGKEINKVVRKGLMTPRYYYYLYDQEGQFEAIGKTKALSLGLLFPSQIVINISDEREHIGTIKGRFFTWSRAKFDFFDLHGDKIASAYLSDRSSNIMLVSKDSKKRVLAKMKSEFGHLGILSISFSNVALPMDERILKIFTAYISDFHKSFIHHPGRDHE